MSSTKKGHESDQDSEVVCRLRFKKNLAAFLNVLFWIIFTATFYLGFQEKRDLETPSELFTEISEEKTIKKTD